MEASETPHVSAICLTGGSRPPSNVMKIIERSRVPVIASDEGTYALATRIANLVAKILPKDHEKIRTAQRAISELVDVDRIIASTLGR
jgi:BioD-like phosphotransacetylase family protein